MKQLYIIVSALVFCLLCPVTSEAQLLKKLKKKLEKKAEETVEKQVDKTVDGVLGEDDNKSGVPGSGKPDDPLKDLPKTVYDFEAGTEVIFEDDFSQDTEGSMPRKWKSTGNGSVVNGEDIDANGTWLQLYNDQVYQLADTDPLPENFTIEFEVLTRAETASNLRKYFNFGLNRDNNLNKWWNNTVAGIGLNYSKYGKVAFNSEKASKTSVAFPLKNYGWARMKVEIQVNGNWMKVFIDRYKVLDTDMLYPESSKHFYIKAPGYGMKKTDRIYIGNVRIAKL